MKLGNNETIILAILKKYPKISIKQLDNLFIIITQKKARLDLIIHALKMKGFLIENEELSVDKSSIKDIDLPEITIKKEQVKELKNSEEIKIGKIGKSIIYVLEKTEKSSLQFLSEFFQKPTKNIYAIMQRLEEKTW